MVANVDDIDTSDFVLKTMYNTDKAELQNKIPDVSNLVKKTKLTELEKKIPDLSNLATKTGIITVENKIPLVKKYLLLKKQTIILKLQKLKRNLMTIIMTNILIRKSLIN